MVFGKGINDLSCDIESYQTWHSMIRRSYSPVYHKSKPTYIGTEVAQEWLILSIFNKWFVLNNVQGWQLDKDLLGQGLKLYSKETCVFLPNEINCALQIDKGKNGLPPGVSYKTSHQKYVAQLSILDENNQRKNKHLVISSSIAECEEVYRIEKEKYIRSLAQKHVDKLDRRAYDALLKFEVKGNT